MEIHNNAKLPEVEKFIRQFLQPFDTSKVELHLNHTSSHHRSGVCKYPTPRSRMEPYRIYCRIQSGLKYPYKERDYVNCSNPSGMEHLDHVSRESLIWKYDEEQCSDEEDLMVAVIGHELGHFIAKSGQTKKLETVYGIQGHRNTQSACNRLGFWFLREFKRWRNNGRGELFTHRK